MTKTETYNKELLAEEDWVEYLKENSNLPGPRGNLELLAVAVELGNEVFFNKCLAFKEEVAPTNTPGEFVACCGAAGLGKLVLEGKDDYFIELRKLASDNRWRVREGVAMALQYIGEKDFDKLISEMKIWKDDNLLVKRAVVAGLCEPALLKKKENALETLSIIKAITLSIENIQERKTESFRVIKMALAYGISVAVVAYPEKGKAVFEDLMKVKDKDIQWILKENLKKNRMAKMDEEWVEGMENERMKE